MSKTASLITKNKFPSHDSYSLNAYILHLIRKTLVIIIKKNTHYYHC